MNNVNVPLGKAEMKRLIKKTLRNKWQDLWEKKGRHSYEINKEVGSVRKICGKRRDYTITSRLCIWHTALNQSFFSKG